MNMIFQMYSSLILLTSIVLFSDAARILTVAPFFGKSHAMFIHSISLELAARGHDVTIITSNPVQNPPDNYQQITVEEPEFMQLVPDESLFTFSRRVPLPLQLCFVYLLGYESTRTAFNNTQVQELIKRDDHYDLVISEMLFPYSMYMFAHKYNAPLVLLGATTYLTWMNEFMGGPTTTSYLGHEFSQINGEMNLSQRVYNYIFSGYSYLLHKYVLFYFTNRLARQHFGNSSQQELPSLEEIENNVSLVLLNTHFSLDDIRPMVPGIVEVGGAHLKAAKPLPENIKKFLDEAKDGAIYVSFGSQLKSTKMPEDKKQAFFKAFVKLKQRIIWKWEDDNLPKDLKNVFAQKWLPQSDILAHPNIKAFITQCGMLSTQEAVYRGVPVIGMPIYGDQPVNMAKLQSRGMGVMLEYADVSEESVSQAISKILTQKSYSKAAKTISERFRDKPNTSLDTAVFWIEYTIRHNGSSFMKSRAVHLPFYKYYALDVGAVIFSFLVCSFYTVRVLKKYRGYIVHLKQKIQ